MKFEDDEVKMEAAEEEDLKVKSEDEDELKEESKGTRHGDRTGPAAVQGQIAPGRGDRVVLAFGWPCQLPTRSWRLGHTIPPYYSLILEASGPKVNSRVG